MEAKLKALKAPLRFSVRPVLNHVNGVTNELVDADYFALILDLGQLL